MQRDLTPAVTRAEAINAARAVIREYWPLGYSTERIGAYCGMNGKAVLQLAREMGLEERSRKKVVADCDQLHGVRR